MSEHGLGGDGSFDTRDWRVLIRSFYTAPFVAPIPPPRAVSPVSHSIPLSMAETPELERLVPSNSLDLTGRYLVPWTELLHIPYDSWSTLQSAKSALHGSITRCTTTESLVPQRLHRCFGFTTSPAYIQATHPFSRHDMKQTSRLDLPKGAARGQWPIRQLFSVRRVQKHRIPPPRLHGVQPDRPVLWVLEDEKDENDRTSQAGI